MAEKENVIVTGSSGLVGSAVVRALASQYQVIGFDRDGDPHPPIEAECICVDVTDPGSVRRGLERVRYAYGERIASVIHLAAYYDFSGRPSPKYEEVTVRGTERLLRLLQDFQVEQFLFSSTMLVHRPAEPGLPISEDDPLEGKWAYPQSKIETEQVIHEHRGSIPAVYLRIAGIYTDVGDSIPVTHQIQRIFERKLTAYVYPGDISRGQAFVHLDDVVDAIKRTVARRKELPEQVALLIGESETYSYDQLQRTIGRLIHGEAWETQQIPKAVARTGAWVQDRMPGIDEPFVKAWMIRLADDHYELDISRARELLGWQPQHRLIDTLPKMVGALEADPVAWYERHGMESPSNLEEMQNLEEKGDSAEREHRHG